MVRLPGPGAALAPLFKGSVAEHLSSKARGPVLESQHDKIKLTRDGVRMLRGPRCYSQKQFSMLSANFRVNLEVFARGLGVRIILMIVLIHDFFCSALGITCPQAVGTRLEELHLP